MGKVASPGQQLLDAMVRGVTRAGFVNVRGRHEPRDGGLVLALLADCPCGRGTSRWAQLFEGRTLKLAPIETLAAGIEAYGYEVATAHIEEDRREGRWTDSHHPAEAKPQEGENTPSE